MKNTIFFALILVGLTYFSSCQKDEITNINDNNTIVHNTNGTSGVDSTGTGNNNGNTTHPLDSSNFSPNDTTLTQAQKEAVMQEVLALFNQDPTNQGIVIGSRDTSIERYSSQQWTPIYQPSISSCPVAGQVHWYTINPIKGKEYRANASAAYGKYILGLVLYDPNTGTGQNIEVHTGNSAEHPTKSIEYSKYDLQPGKELRLFVRAITDLEYYFAIYKRPMKAHLRVDLSGWKHVYQSRLPVDYDDTDKFMNGQSYTMFPLYTGRAQYSNYGGENLCALASYIMARGIVGGLGSLSDIGNTPYDKACQLAEARHRINYMINSGDMGRNGSYSLYNIFQYANGSQYFRGDYFDYGLLFGDCNNDGINDDKDEDCKAELTSPPDYNSAYNKVRHSIINGHPVIVGMIGNFSHHPSNPSSYITANRSKGHHIVTIVGIDELDNQEKYVLYTDPYFDERRIWQCEANRFFASMKANGSGKNHSMLILKGH